MLNEQQETNTENVQATEQTQTTPVDTATPPVESQTQEQKQPEAETETKPDIPESADAYKVELEGFDFDAFKSNEDNKAFLESAHQAGLTNEQMSVVMKAYDQHTAVQVEALQQDWGNDYEANLRFANQAIQAAGLQVADVDSPTFGIRLAAYFGKALQEDMPPQNTQQSSGQSREELMASQAYMDANHPDHKKVYAQVERLYQKEFQG
ncbi:MULTISPECIES: hypothetical protein [Acinetobacter calcoaceticus/baumannii complex]|uniref:hypothetical protein n=1 Tax=Acinetobacter calcoaceticus/baumannii complex TaxID=909768 RepID=UPI00028CA0F6|nr:MULTISPECIES: hypothetical protein [Acinetobacter calcoaceticus/baumannii complex]EKF46118.1 hypothetical protein W9I_03266 [Acinetobacter nosocomialis Ab22222]EXS45594.1 hypothetical protein J660_2503 [Acinetobacter sp. 88816]MDH2667313.1 hypothetical protein [Acinetobacter baumannii]HAV5345220.1 hypothetical protein [Acinetobacter baumannii]